MRGSTQGFGQSQLGNLPSDSMPNMHSLSDCMLVCVREVEISSLKMDKIFKHQFKISESLFTGSFHKSCPVIDITITKWN